MRVCLLVVALVFSTSAALTAQDSANLVPQIGHTENVLAASISSDKANVVTGSRDGQVILWDAATGRELRLFEGATNEIYAVAYSPTSQTVVAGGRDGTIRFWDARTGEIKNHISLGSDLRAAAFTIAISADGQTLAIAIYQKIVFIDLKTGRQWDYKVTSLIIHQIAISADGRSVAIDSSEEGGPQVIDRDTGAVKRVFRSVSESVVALAISPDGAYLLTGLADQTLRLWSITTGSQIRQYDWPQIYDKVTDDDEGMPNRVNAVAFSPRKGDDRIFAGGDDGVLRIYDASSSAVAGQMDSRLEGEQSVYQVNSIAISLDGTKALTAHDDNSARMWDLRSKQLEQRFAGDSAAVIGLAMPTPDGLLTSSDGTTSRLWDLRIGRESPVVAMKHILVFHATFSGDGKYFLGSDFTDMQLWDTKSGKRIKKWSAHGASGAQVGHAKDLRSSAISQDGKQAASMAQSDPQVLLWDTHTGKRTGAIQSTGTAISAAFSPDGKDILIASEDDDRSVWSWNIAGASPVREKQYSDGAIWTIGSIAYSADGHDVIVTANDRIELFDRETGQLKESFAGGCSNFTSSALSKDNRILLAGSEGNVACVYSVSSHQFMWRLSGQHASVTAVAISPDNAILATGSMDGTTRLWSGATGKYLATLVSFAHGGWAVVDASNRFDTNDLDGKVPLNWVLASDPLHALPVAIFMRDYYTPGLLARILKGATLPPIRSIAEIPNRIQPDVQIVGVSPSPGTADHVDVTVRAASHYDAVQRQASGLQDLRLFRDGQLIGSGWVDARFVNVQGAVTQKRVSGGYVEGGLADGEYVFHDVLVKSDEAKVSFSAYAFNSERIKSETSSLDYERTASTAVVPRVWLIQIGVNHIKDAGCGELRFAVNDAEKLNADLLLRFQMPKYEAHSIKIESIAPEDEQLARPDAVKDATKSAIRSKIAEIARGATPNDIVFLSFSGHGYSTGDGRFYILPSDTTCEVPDDSTLPSAISADELADWLRAVDAGQITLILDACFSARSVEGRDFKPGPMGSHGLGQLAYDKRMRILAASQSEQTAGEYGGTLHQGLLTYVLTHDGLDESKADWNPQDGHIWVGEWLSYAVNAVPNLASTLTTSSMFLEAHKGPTFHDKDGKPVTIEHSDPLQIPALFDFALADIVELEQAKE
jgi:WD40 repeat protein